MKQVIHLESWTDNGFDIEDVSIFFASTRLPNNETWSVSDRLLGIVNMPIRYESLYKDVGSISDPKTSFPHYLYAFLVVYSKD